MKKLEYCQETRVIQQKTRNNIKSYSKIEFTFVILSKLLKIEEKLAKDGWKNNS